MHRLLVLLALTPVSVAAQSYASAGLFVARNGSLPTEPNLAGLELRSGYSSLAMRLSAGMGPVFSSVFGERGVDRERLYGAVDLDLQLDLARQGSIALMPFVGVGMAGVSREDDGGADAVSTWSWGGALRIPFASNMALQLEARRRIPFDEEEAFEFGIERGWEQRVGLTFGFGGGGRRSYADAEAREARDRDAREREAREAREREVARREPVVEHHTITVYERVPASRLTARRLRVIETAESYLGTRYRYSGSSPREGFDCSGFVRYVYSRNGISLPRSARDQAERGRRVSYGRSTLLPGDLLFFRLEGRRVDHVAIYAGDGRIIHAPSGGGSVRYDELDSRRGRWYVDRLVTVRRVIHE